MILSIPSMWQQACSGRSSWKGGLFDRTKMRELGSGYVSEIDTVDELTWCEILEQFDDANIYQTWSYAAVRCGRQNTSHLLLKEKGDIVAIAQAEL